MLWILEVINVARELAKSGRSFLANLLLLSVGLGSAGYAGSVYVDSRHSEVRADLKKHSKRLATLSEDKSKEIEMMHDISGAISQIRVDLKGVQATLEKNESRVWQIHRDLYKIKTGDFGNVEVKSTREIN